ncbi:class I poly(R)-hydroxyalkanoic acid synthase [Kaistia dalseonensis]|uniref:Polyhydroxyalkanoate synthase n=1 Tax=Kaistia dalseonensis TaxID=410840 RepID=A0ABU0H3X3_9HYPH|nr:class I poly(R)-hydroxyalkanoic acid synthase [Kaistia dalseonensis]MCX5494143.1 class I poly(R)-hydroxyalkanoic acid synthase [Kaistia dalseonensis]MDQ0436722.1 polyhydroxyalkanoate synthase [Kaistia dalseonensis]
MAKETTGSAQNGSADDAPISLLVKDPEKFAQNIARIIEGATKAANAFLKPREDGKLSADLTDEIAEIVRTLAKVIEYWTSDPSRTVLAQRKLYTRYFALWTAMMQRMAGAEAKPIAVPEPRDKRFNDPQWSKNQFFDFLKQFYLITTRWAEEMVEGAELDPHTRLKALFYVRQIANAVSPSNFLFTNPEVLRETLDSSADNLVRGVNMLAEDIEAGEGSLRIRQVDNSRFEIGKNLALTPGKVIHQNEVRQLIQYKPMTKEVLKRPLLVVAPWINKFYILDLNPEKSFIKWALEQGHTVFVVSWVNPDERQAAKGFEHYMREGILESLDVIEKITGEKEVNAIGYCVGGTLMSYTLAYMAAVGDTRIASATLFATQVDFTYAGDLKVFMDEDQIEAVEKKMSVRGYLEGQNMASAFNMLRSNELIWSYVVNNYFRGKEPIPFDLLYWNSDTTRMPAANHSFYLRNCYLDNKLAQGQLSVDGTPLDLHKVKIPIFNLATREDHIAPPRSVYFGSSFFGGPVTFVLSGSGHIAGVVNPPSRGKYQYWTGPAPQGDDLDLWLANAEEHPGSWWPHWQAWIEALDARKVKARTPGGRKVKAIEDAPGSYVRVMA